MRDRFLAEAEAADRPASRLVRDFTRNYVNSQTGARQQDAWFRAEVESDLREADEPDAAFISNDDVLRELRERRDSLVARLERPPPF